MEGVELGETWVRPRQGQFQLQCQCLHTVRSARACRESRELGLWKSEFHLRSSHWMVTLGAIRVSSASLGQGSWYHEPGWLEPCGVDGELWRTPATISLVPTISKGYVSIGAGWNHQPFMMPGPSRV